jgi:hypothetical protein
LDEERQFSLALEPAATGRDSRVTLSRDLSLRARAMVAGRLGLRFPEGRGGDFERRLARAIQGSPTSDPGGYLAWLGTLPAESPEWGRLAGHLTSSETSFLRDRACFEALRRHVLPPLIAARRASRILRLRLWSAGCATGEEPFPRRHLLPQGAGAEHHAACHGPPAAAQTCHPTRAPRASGGG